MTQVNDHGTRAAMTEALLDTLPLSHRLALSYAPARARDAVLGLMALDMRLAGIIAGDGEPMIAQIKLAWWRDRLSEDTSDWPAGEPLLALLSTFPGDLRRLIPLVDGYETLLGEAFDRPALATYLRGKSHAWAAVADGDGDDSTLTPVEQAAKEVALHDLANRLSEEGELALVKQSLQKQPWRRAALSRSMRSLAVLHALCKRARSRDQAELLDGPGAMIAAMRVGITGR